MQKKISARIAGLFALTLAAFIAVSGIGTMDAYAADNSAVTDEINDYSYEDVNTMGAAVTIKNTILKVKKNNAAQTPKPTKVTVNGKTLKLNRDYTVLYQYLGGAEDYYSSWETVDSITVPGQYRICLKGTGDYHGVYTRRVYAYDAKTSVPVSAFKVTVNKVPYTGEKILDGVVKSVKYKNKVLVEDRDYFVDYINNVDSGTGLIRITGNDHKGFVGEREVKFTITGGTKIGKAKVTGITAKAYAGGNALTQDNVKLTYKGSDLVQGADYSVQYVNNTKAGTVKMVFTGKGRYYGTVTKTFKITKIKLNQNMLDKASQSIVVKHSGKAVKPEVSLTDDNGNQLVKGVDYTLAYKNNVKISDKAAITVKGKGNYTGSFKINFTITDKEKEDDQSGETGSEESKAEEVSIEKEIKNEDSETNAEEGEGIRNENLNGRGRADSGRSEPQYVNVIGYVVVGYDQNYKLEHTDNFENTDLWVIPTYEQDKQFWNDTSVVIPHKTEVIVREQILSHEKYGAYSGYLLVENLEDGKQYYIKVSNFVTKPYWTYSDDLRTAALTGDFIAVYHQVSDYYPVTNGGDKAEIEDGKVVLVNGVAGLSRNVNPDVTGIDAVVWQEWRLGYGDVTVHFNAEDLTIIY